MCALGMAGNRVQDHWAASRRDHAGVDRVRIGWLANRLREASITAVIDQFFCFSRGSVLSDREPTVVEIDNLCERRLTYPARLVMKPLLDIDPVYKPRLAGRLHLR